MPQITLEYSTNISIDFEFDDLFKSIHLILQDVTGIDIDNCKSRAFRHGDFFIGGGGNKSFVHLELAILEGRSEELKKLTGSRILKTMENYFLKNNPENEMQITVELRDILKNSYFKFPKGTLTKQ